MKKLLIVEDDRTLASALQDKFIKEGFECLMAISYDEVIAQIAKSTPDIILLDIMLPGSKNGFDILEQFKREGKLKDLPD